MEHAQTAATCVRRSWSWPHDGHVIVLGSLGLLFRRFSMKNGHGRGGMDLYVAHIVSMDSFTAIALGQNAGHPGGGRGVPPLAM